MFDSLFLCAVGISVGVFHVAQDCLIGIAGLVVMIRSFKAGEFIAAEKLEQSGETSIRNQCFGLLNGQDCQGSGHHVIPNQKADVLPRFFAEPKA